LFHTKKTNLQLFLFGESLNNANENKLYPAQSLGNMHKTLTATYINLAGIIDLFALLLENNNKG
jgi:hypothetical protein